MKKFLLTLITALALNTAFALDKDWIREALQPMKEANSIVRKKYPSWDVMTRKEREATIFSDDDILPRIQLAVDQLIAEGTRREKTYKNKLKGKYADKKIFTETCYAVLLMSSYFEDLSGEEWFMGTLLEDKEAEIPTSIGTETDIFSLMFGLSSPEVTTFTERQEIYNEFKHLLKKDYLKHEQPAMYHLAILIMATYGDLSAKAHAEKLCNYCKSNPQKCNMTKYKSFQFNETVLEKCNSGNYKKEVNKILYNGEWIKN